MTTEAIRSFREIIYSYFKTHGRKLPWRETADPYCIFVSEVMLQQTQVDRVTPKYMEFIAAFPGFASLAQAELKDVLKVWQGLGYNRRAGYLHESARIICADFGGNLPDDPDILMTLPGIGRATAHAIVAFAYNKPVVFLETNIRSIFIHFFFQDRQKVGDSDILPLAAQALDRDNPRRWYSALMDSGARLKKSTLNPSRKSAGFSRQSPFSGSDREIRGAIIRLLVEQSRISEDELVVSLIADKERIQRIINKMEKEGLLHVNGGLVSIA